MPLGLPSARESTSARTQDSREIERERERKKEGEIWRKREWEEVCLWIRIISVVQLGSPSTRQRVRALVQRLTMLQCICSSGQLRNAPCSSMCCSVNCSMCCRECCCNRHRATDAAKNDVLTHNHRMYCVCLIVCIHAVCLDVCIHIYVSTCTIPLAPPRKTSLSRPFMAAVVVPSSLMRPSVTR